MSKYTAKPTSKVPAALRKLDLGKPDQVLSSRLRSRARPSVVQQQSRVVTAPTTDRPRSESIAKEFATPPISPDFPVALSKLDAILKRGKRRVNIQLIPLAEDSSEPFEVNEPSSSEDSPLSNKERSDLDRTLYIPDTNSEEIPESDSESVSPSQSSRTSTVENTMAGNDVQSNQSQSDINRNGVNSQERSQPPPSSSVQNAPVLDNQVPASGPHIVAQPQLVDVQSGSAVHRVSTQGAADSVSVQQPRDTQENRSPLSSQRQLEDANRTFHGNSERNHDQNTCVNHHEGGQDRVRNDSPVVIGTFRRDGYCNPEYQDEFQSNRSGAAPGRSHSYHHQQQQRSRDLQVEPPLDREVMAEIWEQTRLTQEMNERAERLDLQRSKDSQSRHNFSSVFLAEQDSDYIDPVQRAKLWEIGKKIRQQAESVMDEQEQTMSFGHAPLSKSVSFDQNKTYGANTFTRMPFATSTINQAYSQAPPPQWNGEIVSVIHSQYDSEANRVLRNGQPQSILQSSKRNEFSEVAENVGRGGVQPKTTANPYAFQFPYPDQPYQKPNNDADQSRYGSSSRYGNQRDRNNSGSRNDRTQLTNLINLSNNQSCIGNNTLNRTVLDSLVSLTKQVNGLQAKSNSGRRTLEVETTQFDIERAKALKDWAEAPFVNKCLIPRKQLSLPQFGLKNGDIRLLIRLYEAALMSNPPLNDVEILNEAMVLMGPEVQQCLFRQMQMDKGEIRSWAYYRALLILEFEKNSREREMEAASALKTRRLRDKEPPRHLFRDLDQYFFDIDSAMSDRTKIMTLAETLRSNQHQSAKVRGWTHLTWEEVKEKAADLIYEKRTYAENIEYGRVREKLAEAERSLLSNESFPLTTLDVFAMNNKPDLRMPQNEVGWSPHMPEQRMGRDPSLPPHNSGYVPRNNGPFGNGMAMNAPPGNSYRSSYETGRYSPGPEPGRTMQHSHYTGRTNSQSPGRPVRSSSVDPCFRCGKTGHWLKDCPRAPPKLTPCLAHNTTDHDEEDCPERRCTFCEYALKDSVAARGHLNTQCIKWMKSASGNPIEAQSKERLLKLTIDKYQTEGTTETPNSPQIPKTMVRVGDKDGRLSMEPLIRPISSVTVQMETDEAARYELWKQRTSDYGHQVSKNE
ncbi:hypothetical protein BV898_19103 [Hypsibius exemplaris]|uniref:CCHC-type domain-containing protein n=1 Tax=Hypsibius exemplaris TaxID=2072580 RepID=A0A9X6NIF2_HYPEX|nr:hypothetical protein BV898_19103 [Hypsibius exemplaris]